MGKRAELVLDARAEIGEGAIWYDHILYWVDIPPGKVFAYDPATGANREMAVGQMVGTVVPREQGGLALAVEEGFALLDLETGALTLLENPEAGMTVNRMNDGKCDPAGRFWAGTMNRAEEGPTGALYCMDADHTIHKRVENVTISNGIVWSRDCRTMYYIDSPTCRVDAFDYDLASGKISNRRTAISIPEELGWPDGMAIDENENVWVAMFAGSAVTHWDPRTGKLLGTIEVPASQVTSCAFGGPDLDEMFITSATWKMSEDQLTKEPSAGGLFKCKPGVRGLPAVAYKG
jgi:sugar lactone lactonase YvrE